MKNILTKYNITEEELNRGIDIIAKSLGNICNVSVMLALADLIRNGDIPEQ